MITIDEALDRLLHRASVLAGFLERGPAALDVSAEDAAALAVIDRAELARTARRVREEVLARQHRGGGTLLTMFARTIAAYPGGPLRLAEAFLESRAFDGHREVPFAGVGCSLEEAFYRFAEAAEIGAAEEREAEFLAAMLRALAVNSRPDFVVPAEVRRAPAGFFAVGVRGEPTLFAALGGRFVTGTITPFLAELLLADGQGEAVARRHGVADGVLAASLEHLAGLGLVAGATIV